MVFWVYRSFVVQTRVCLLYSIREMVDDRTSIEPAME